MATELSGIFIYRHENGRRAWSSGRAYLAYHDVMSSLERFRNVYVGIRCEIAWLDARRRSRKPVFCV